MIKLINFFKWIFIYIDICILSDYSQDTLCEDSSSIKYNCPSLTETCTIEKNQCNLLSYSKVCKFHFVLKI